MPSPSSVESYSRDLATRLSSLHEVAHLLVQEQQAYHHKLINSHRSDPRVYSVGNDVFAQRAVRSDASKSRIDKLRCTFTGPWRITAFFKGVSYKLEHCSKPNRKEKKHASNLSPCPLELIPFEPVDGSDTQYDQLHKPIQASPYKEAGIEGFKPLLPFKVLANYFTTDSVLAFHWPSLSELNNNIAPFQW